MPTVAAAAPTASAYLAPVSNASTRSLFAIRDFAAIRPVHEPDDRQHREEHVDVVFAEPAGDEREQHGMARRQRRPLRGGGAASRREKADQRRRRDAGKRGEIGRRARDDDEDEQDQRNQRRPVGGELRPDVGQLLRREAAQARALRLEMHLHEHPVEVHERRHDRRDDDRLVRQVEELDHQERRRAHDRRRDLAAGRRRGLDGAREVARIAQADHRGNRQRADRHGVRDRRARQHPEQSRREDADLRRTAGVAARDRRRDIDEELTEADARREHAEQHEVEHERRDDADRDPVDALARHVEVVDEARPRRAGMLQQARKRRPCERVEHEHDGDHGERPSHRAARRLEQQHDEDRPHRHVDRERVAHAKGEILEDPRYVEDGGRDREAEHPVRERHAAGRKPRMPARHVQHRLARRKDQEHESEDEREVDAAMRRFAQQPESGGVIVEARQDDQQTADHEARRRGERPEPHLGIVFLFELDRFRGVDFLHANPPGVPHAHPRPRAPRK